MRVPGQALLPASFVALEKIIILSEPYLPIRRMSKFGEGRRDPSYTGAPPLNSLTPKAWGGAWVSL